MSSLRDPVLDERFEGIVAQLRSTRPAASPQLRERVRGVARVERAPRRRRLLRPALVLAGVVLAAAAVAGLATLRGGEAREAGGEAAQSLEAEAAAPVEDEPVGGAEALAPTPGRLQDYRAELTVRVAGVDELSAATASAMRAARELGGYVVSAAYDTPSGGEGDSRLVLRVPLARVQDAIARLSGLGTIVAQRIDLQDLQQTADEQAEAIARLRARIAALERQLAAAGLSEEERVVLRSRLEAARDELARALEARDATVRAGSFAEVTLTLTTREAPPPPRESVLGDAVGALGTASTWALAALIVAGPFLAAVAGASLVFRRLRRRADDRLLDRS